MAAVSSAKFFLSGISTVFSFNLERHSYPVIRELIDILCQDPVDDPTADALVRLNVFLDEGAYDALKDESDQVFFSPATSFLPMTASYYHEKRDDGSKRLEMMDYVFASNYRRNSVEFKENEDHIAFIFLFMQKLIAEEVAGNTASGVLARRVFDHILNAMLDDFASNLFNHEKSSFYRHVAVVLHSFATIERIFLDVELPTDRDRRNLTRSGLTKEKKPPREIVRRNFDEFGSN